MHTRYIGISKKLRSDICDDIRQPARRTSVLSLYMYDTAFRGAPDYPLANAISTFMVALSLVLIGLTKQVERRLGVGSDEARAGRKSMMSREISVATRVLLYAVLFGFTVMTLYPILWLIMSSCKTTQEFQLNRLGFPRGIHFDNFAQAWRIGGFSTLFLNSVFYTGISTIVVVGFSLAADLLVIKFFIIIPEPGVAYFTVSNRYLAGEIVRADSYGRRTDTDQPVINGHHFADSIGARARPVIVANSPAASSMLQVFPLPST